MKPIPWISRLRLDELGICRRILHLKGASRFRKKELVDHLSRAYGILRIQRVYRHYSNTRCLSLLSQPPVMDKPADDEHLKAECPFTMDPPEWPFWVRKNSGPQNGGDSSTAEIKQYYNLQPLVHYLSTQHSRDDNGSPRCPVTRIPFTTAEMNSITALANNNGMVIEGITPINTTDIQLRQTRGLLDQMVGDIVDIVINYNNGLSPMSYRALTTAVNRNIVPVVVEHFNKLSNIDTWEAQLFIQSSINTINQEYESPIREYFIYFFTTLANDIGTQRDPR